MKKKEQKEPVASANTDNEAEIVEFPFKVIEGGRVATDSLPPDPNDWLAQLPIGTLFLAGDKRSADYITPEYEVIDKVPGYSNLKLERPTQSIKTEVWVCTSRFSQRYYQAHILGIFRDNE